MRDLVRGFVTHVVRQPCPQFVSERVVDARVPEPVTHRGQLGRRHPLIGLGELAGTLLPQQ